MKEIQLHIKISKGDPKDLIVHIWDLSNGNTYQHYTRRKDNELDKMAFLRALHEAFCLVYKIRRDVNCSVIPNNKEI